MSESKICVWTVEFSSQSEQKYRYNGTVTVVAMTAQRAIALVVEAHPDATIHGLHKRSRGELIVDNEIEALPWSGEVLQ